MRRILMGTAAAALLATAACDKDPVQSNAVFALSACPAAAGGRLNVNTPITFNFSEALLSSSVTNGNVVVSDALTGQELQGSVTLLSDSGGRSIQFTPAAALPFDRELRIRLQNLLNSTADASIGLTVCDVRTGFPPIREQFFAALSPAGGSDLLGVSLVAPNTGFVISRAVTLFKSTGQDFTLIAAPPQFSGSFDVAFVDPLRGFAAFEDQRRQRTMLTQSIDGGITFDTLFSTQRSQNRLFFRRVGPGNSDIFGVIGAGFGSDGAFIKYAPNLFRSVSFQAFANTGTVNDLDFGSDTTRGVGVSLGVRIGSFIRYGRVYYTSNGGSFWTEVPGSQATDRVLTYRGVAVQGDTTVYVVGGNAFAARYVRNADGSLGARTIFRPDSGSTGFEGPPLVSIDTTNPDALVFNDVAFDMQNPSIGFIVGAQLIGNVNGVPRYQGIIFQTRDGGKTWRRQGVRGAPNNGADFPRLNHISLFRPSPTGALSAWVVGDGGYTIAFAPCVVTTKTPTQQPNGDIACQ